MPALRVLWRALVSLYDETPTLVMANLLWLVLNLPVFVLLVVVGLAFAEPGSQVWLVVGVAWLLLLLPTPAGVALGALARQAAGPDVPQRRVFWDALRARWRLSLACTGASLLVTAAIVFNLAFYANQTDSPLRLLSILWVYALALWLGLHVYLVPLIHHVQQPRLLDLYRRAALIALGQAAQTLLVLLLVLVLGGVCILFLPAYVLVGASLAAMIQAHALREVRRRLGDLSIAEADQETGA